MQQLDNQEILMKLKASKQFWDIKKKIKQGFNEQLKIGVNDIQKFAQSCEIEDQLIKLISHILKKSKKRETLKEDQIEFLNTSKIKWTELLFKNLDIVHQKTKNQEEDDTNTDSKLYIYDEKNLLAFLQTFKQQQSNSLYQNVQFQSNKLLNINIPLKSSQSILDKYQYLLLQEELQDDKINKIRKQIENEHLDIELEKIAQNFVPNGERCLLYLKYFEFDHQETVIQQNFAKLQKECSNQLFYDELLEIDGHEISEDTFYFVFQEQILTCLKCFIRDKTIKENIRIQLQSGLKKENTEFQLPVAGFFPFKNISKYVAPICYLSTKIHIIYALFKEFFCRYFCFLHSISSENNSILALCMQIEEIVSTRSPKLFHHLKVIGSDTLKLIMHQLVYCFIGDMDPPHILTIYDQIIGHDSLEILIILCVGFLNKYKPKLLLAKNYENVQQIFSELREDKFQELVQFAYKQ
ncbi:unnamed protein product [Paramecium sonneborni]|uniref:Rab-GAP TBC domain-containing protein n=1 Tax=Paramecium sonneborni TaxID=65129 RepID=A0A8S1LM37_9CILI|nr:unnamed protein product [Paramecium sonneborni]